MPLLTNCYFSTKRAQVATTGGTNIPQPYLTGIAGHVMPHRTLFDQGIFDMTAGGGSFEATYMMRMDIGMDVTVGDLIYHITNIDGSLWQTGAGTNDTWRVVFAYDAPPTLLLERVALVTRVIGGGIVP